MSRYLKFTLGSPFDGYKTVEIFIADDVSYKILRNGLLNVEKNKKISAQMGNEWLSTLDELNIPDWEQNYPAETHGETLWELIFKDDTKIYRCEGSNSFPENWERFLDWLDDLIPDLQFVNRKRLEKITLNYSRNAQGKEISEKLTLDRRDKLLTLDKKFSRHFYYLDSEIDKIFDSAQIFFDNLEVLTAEEDDLPKIIIDLVRHDASIETFETFYSETCIPDLKNFVELIKTVTGDLSAEIFSPGVANIITRRDKFIFCKVQFPSSYKHYTYRAEDETLSVGDVVDVPVGKNNDVAQAKIVEIGYFDEYEAPFPIEKIKKIIGKHVTDDLSTVF